MPRSSIVTFRTWWGGICRWRSSCATTASSTPSPRSSPTRRQLWRYAAAADIIAWRHQVLTDLDSKGVLSVDVFPEQMTAPLVNRYLEIKARHLL